MHNIFKVDQFGQKAWEPDNKQALRAWEEFREDFNKTRLTEDSFFNFRLNLINDLQPFVNKRGIRKRPFVGEEHVVQLAQVDNIPGSAKLIYKNSDKQVGTYVPVYLSSKDNIRKDVEGVSKKLFKKAKKLL